MTTKTKPVKMKPVKAWALVNKQTGALDYLNRTATKQDMKDWVLNSQRIARVTITEDQR